MRAQRRVEPAAYRCPFQPTCEAVVPRRRYWRFECELVARGGARRCARAPGRGSPPAVRGNRFVAVRRQADTGWLLPLLVSPANLCARRDRRVPRHVEHLAGRRPGSAWHLRPRTRGPNRRTDRESSPRGHRADVQTGVAAEAVAWLTDRTLVAALQRGGIVLIDPVTGEVVGRWAGWAALDGVSTRTRRRFVLLEPGGRTRRLATVDQTGRLRSMSLRLPLRRRFSKLARPALVADPVREHAYVLTGARVVVDVDLKRMRVRRRRLQPRLKQSAARARFPVRDAVWLGSGRLAVSGQDAVPVPGRPLRPRTYPAGLSTVDTQSWKVA